MPIKKKKKKQNQNAKNKIQNNQTPRKKANLFYLQE